MNTSDIAWHFPYALLIAAVPMALRALAWFKRRRLLNYAQAHLSPWAMQETAQPIMHSWSESLLWLLLALALAGPRVPAESSGQAVPEPRRDDVNIMIVLDVSAAMLKPVHALPALDRARLELDDLLVRTHGERVGLIISAATSGLLLPPTTDYAQLREFLLNADASLLDAQASSRVETADLAAAITRAQAELRGKRGGILLLSRAASAGTKGEAANTLFRIAKEAKARNTEIAVLDVAEPGEGADLEEFSRLAGAAYARATDGDAEWRNLYDARLRGIQSAQRPLAGVTAWRELFVWPLAVAAGLLFVTSYRLPKRLTAAGVAALLIPGANGASLSEAYQALNSNEFARAQLTYSQLPGYAARMGEGASAYRRKDYEHAANQFALALLEARDTREQGAALFNLGNARFLQGRFDAAIEAYRDAQKAQPYDNRIAHNWALAQTRLATQRRNRTEGVPGRRGAQLGGGHGEDISERAAGMEDEKRTDPWMTLDESEAARRAMRAELGGRGGAAPSSLRSDAAARIARKKVEMLQDDQRRLLRGLLIFESQRQSSATPR